MKTRRAHFTVWGRFDGAARARVTIEQSKVEGGLDRIYFIVKPNRRKKRELPLKAVAEMVLWKAAKEEAKKK